MASDRIVGFLLRFSSLHTFGRSTDRPQHESFATSTSHEVRSQIWNGLRIVAVKIEYAPQARCIGGEPFRAYQHLMPIAGLGSRYLCAWLCLQPTCMLAATNSLAVPVANMQVRLFGPRRSVAEVALYMWTLCARDALKIRRSCLLERCMRHQTVHRDCVVLRLVFWRWRSFDSPMICADAAMMVCTAYAAG